MPLLQIFRKDKRYWTPEEIQEVELFYTLTPFFSPYYEHLDFDTVTAFTFYAKIWSNDQFSLSHNKKSVVLILLQGQIQVYRPAVGKELRRNKKPSTQILGEKYVKVGQHNGRSEVIELRSDVIVKSKEDVSSQILFIPTMLHDSYIQMVKARRIQAVMDKLVKVFGSVDRSELRLLAQNDCIFREHKMNGYIYRAGTIPKRCYIVVQGSVKVEAPGFQVKKMKQMVIVGEYSIFGQNDLNQEFRTQNALCCSAMCQILQIDKDAFNKLMMRNPKLNPAYSEQLKELRNKKSKSTIQNYSQRLILPRIQRFHSFVNAQDQNKIQKQIVQNCHMLLNLSPSRRASSSFRLPQHKNQEKDYSVNPFEKKVEMFRRRKKSTGRLDLSNKLF